MNSAHGYTEGAEVPQQPQADKANEGREYPFTDLEKRAVEYVKTDDLSMFASDDIRMIHEHYYIKGAQIETASMLNVLKKVLAIARDKKYTTDSEFEIFKQADQIIDKFL